MAKGKRYYWMKLKESFMTSDTVDYFMSLPDGANYVVLYQLLCLKTINTEGRLSRQIGEVIIPFDIEKIRRDCKWFSADTIRVALELYRSFGLVYEDVDGTLVLSDHHNLVGSETDYAEQKRIQREAKQVLPQVDNVHQNVHTDIRDKENRYKDIRYKENESVDVVVADSSDRNTENVDNCVDNRFEYMGGALGKGVVLLTEAQRDALIERLGLSAFNHYVDRLSNFIIDKKANVGNHYQTIVKWAKEDSEICVTD